MTLVEAGEKKKVLEVGLKWGTPGRTESEIY